MADRVGQQLGNYRLIRLLGEGGFAEVYLGEHVHLGTQAAIKVLHTKLTSDEMEQFRLEARTIAHLEHPHIVRILDFGIEGKTPFLVMSYAPNGTLRQRHPKGAVLPVMTMVSYVKQIADALQYAHDEKLIHRDIKPENMLIGRRNEVLLSDFGIALIAQSSRYQSTQDVLGTVAYMAPEQIQGKPRQASDQYSLGIVIYEWLSGDRPFHGSFIELCTQHAVTPPPPLRQRVPSLSPEVEQVILTALAKDPHQRFDSVQAFATALEKACLPVQHPPIVSPSQPLKPTGAAIQSTQQVRPTILDASSSRPPEPAVISTPPEYAQAPQPARQSAPFASPLIQPHTHTVRRTILGLFFYLWGIFCLSCGLSILFIGSTAIFGWVFVASCLVGLVILIFLLRFRKRLTLKTRGVLALEGALLVPGVFVGGILTIVLAVQPQDPVPLHQLGVVCLIYGPFAAFIAYW